MNFSFDSVKSAAKPHDQNFYFDVAMSRGHFFAVLDFAAHDYTNLNAALRAKLETIVGSFSSLPDFSDDLFLGFLAKEVNNFVTNLAQQSSDPELLFSAALCLVSADRFSCFQAGDVRVQILGQDPLPQLEQSQSAKLGKSSLETPLTDQVQSVTLGSKAVVLIMTRSVAETFASGIATTDILDLAKSEPKAICESIMKRTEVVREGRTLVVIGGPYQKEPGAAALDLNTLSSELKASLASLEARLDALAATSQTSADISVEQKFEGQIESLKGDLRAKAPAIDVLELTERVKGIDALLASKADTAAVLGLQRDVLKFGLTSPPAPTESNETVPATSEETSNALVTNEAALTQSSHARSFSVSTALILLAVSLAAGVGGGWLQSRWSRKSPEVWSVKTTGNQLVIGRKDVAGTQPVTISLAENANANGEQTFSSFADVGRYVDTVTNRALMTSQSNQPTQTGVADNRQPEGLTEITIKRGDSLKKLAQTYNVPPEKLRELNPGITRWETVPIGQKVMVPVVGTSATPAPAPAQPTAPDQLRANTTEISVGPGDSLNQLARRFNTTAGKLRELNPNLNWPRIQVGQKVTVPAPAGN